jgi:hypothetical protein
VRVSALKTFYDLDRLLAGQPPRVGLLLGRVDVGKGHEGLHLDQWPELLNSLADQTRVESIRASTAIEGYEVGAERADKLARQPGARIRNRNEREFAGYRDAIDRLMHVEQAERPSISFILHLHRQLYTHTGGGGDHFKTDPNLIASRDEDARVEIFVPPDHPPPHRLAAHRPRVPGA